MIWFCSCQKRIRIESSFLKWPFYQTPPSYLMNQAWFPSFPWLSPSGITKSSGKIKKSVGHRRLWWCSALILVGAWSVFPYVSIHARGSVFAVLEWTIELLKTKGSLFPCRSSSCQWSLDSLMVLDQKLLPKSISYEVYLMDFCQQWKLLRSLVAPYMRFVELPCSWNIFVRDHLRISIHRHIAI